MNNGLLQVLVEEDSGYVKEGKNWGRSEQHSSLVVNEEAQKWYWNSEQMGGGVLEYLIKVRGLNKAAATEILDTRGRIISGVAFEGEKQTQSFIPHEPLVNLLWELGKGNRDYWYDRKLTDSTIDKWRLGFYDGWNLIPLYMGDTFLNFQCRRDLPNKRIKMWYKIENWKPVMLNPELLQIVDTVWITEGPIDAILLNQEGISAVSHTGGGNYWGADWFHYFNRTKKIYYIADHDAVGMNAAIRIAKALGVDRTLIFDFEGKSDKYDTVDYFKEGGTAQELRKLVEENSKNLYEIGDFNERRTRPRRSSLPLAQKFV